MLTLRSVEYRKNETEARRMCQSKDNQLTDLVAGKLDDPRE